MAHLLITDRKDGSRRRAAIEGGLFSVGKKESCSLVLDRINISREHCEIVAADGGYAIRDLKSRNGTFVNGERIGSETVLLDGDVIQLGDFTLVFRAGDKAGESAPAKPGSASSAAPASKQPGVDWPASPKCAPPNSVCDGTPLHWGDAHDPLHSRW